MNTTDLETAFEISGSTFKKEQHETIKLIESIVFQVDKARKSKRYNPFYKHKINMLIKRVVANKDKIKCLQEAMYESVVKSYRDNNTSISFTYTQPLGSWERHGFATAHTDFDDLEFSLINKISSNPENFCIFDKLMLIQALESLVKDYLSICTIVSQKKQEEENLKQVVYKYAELKRVNIDNIVATDSDKRVVATIPNSQQVYFIDVINNTCVKIYIPRFTELLKELRQKDVVTRALVTARKSKNKVWLY